MKVTALDRLRIALILKRIYGMTVPAMFFSGASQSGKSTAMGAFIKVGMEQGLQQIVIDPHGSLYRDLAAFAMTLPASRRKRIHFINFAEGLATVLDTVRWHTSAELSTVVERNLNLIKAAAGDDILKDTPLVDEYMRYAIKAVALLRRNLVEAPAAIDPLDPLYEDIVAELATVDEGLAGRLASIAQMQPREFLANVTPSRRRLEKVLCENTFVRDLLSHPPTFSATDLIEEGITLVISLQKDDSENVTVLRDVDQRFLSCLFITSILDAAYGFLNGSKRCRFILWVDELHLAAGAFHELQKAIAELAKFGVTVAAADQTCFNFPDNVENPLLQSFLANSHYVFHFRSTSELDSRVFSFLPFLVTYAAKRVKNVIRTRSQYVVGHRLMTLVSRSQSWMRSAARGISTSRSASLSNGTSNQLTATQSVARHVGNTVGGSDGTSSSEQSSTSSADGEQIKDIVDGSITGATHGDGRSDSIGKSESHSSSWSRSIMEAVSRSLGMSRGTNSSSSHGVSAGDSATVTEQSGESVTRTPTLVPVYDWQEQVSSITYYQPSELQLEMQRQQATLQVGHCHSVAASLGVARLVFPAPVDVAATIGPVVHTRFDHFVAELRSSASYVDPDAIDGAYRRLADRSRAESNDAIGDSGNDPYPQ